MSNLSWLLVGVIVLAVLALVRSMELENTLAALTEDEEEDDG